MNKSNDITQNSGRDELYMQAASWVAQLDGGALSRADRLALAEWMARSPRHAAELKRLAQLWGQVDALLDATAQPAENTTSSGFWEVVSAWFQFRPLRTSAFVAAPLLVLVMIISSSIYFNPADDNLYPRPITYQTKVGENEKIQLADGSIAYLNTNSIVEVSYSEATRKVRLIRGEALFEVEKNPQRPFQVFAAESMVEAVGTAFVVRLRDSEVDIAVTEGVVRLTDIPAFDNASATDDNTAKPVIVAQTLLSAGHTATVKDDKPVITEVQPEVMQKRTAWRQGVLIFERDSLEYIVNEMARYRSETIVISDPELRKLEMGGVFKTGDLDPLLLALESSLNIDVQRVNDKLIYLNRRKQ